MYENFPNFLTEEESENFGCVIKTDCSLRVWGIFLIEKHFFEKFAVDKARKGKSPKKETSIMMEKLAVRNILRRKIFIEAHLKTQPSPFSGSLNCSLLYRDNLKTREKQALRYYQPGNSCL